MSDTDFVMLPIRFTHDHEGVRRATDWLKERIEDYRDVGHVLFEVHQHELWRHLDYKSFNAYCQDEFGISGKKAADSLVESVRIVEDAIEKRNGQHKALESTRPDLPSPKRPPPEQITPVEVKRAEREPDQVPPPKPPSNTVDYGFDDYKQPIHYAKAREALDIASEFRIARKALVDIEKQLGRCGKVVPGYYDAIKGDIATHMYNLKRCIDELICTRACPLCGTMGDRCRACHGSGVLSKTRFEAYLESRG